MEADLITALADAIAARVIAHISHAAAPAAPPPSQDEWLLPVEAAAYVKLAKATLERLRCVGGGPSFERVGHRVRYRRSALDEWLAGRAAKGLRAPSSAVDKRTTAIVDAHRKGASYAEIGRSIGLTRERVRQVVRDASKEGAR